MNDRVFSFFNVTPGSPEWLDWKWQYRNRITNADALAEIISLSDNDKQDISLCLGGLRMAITPYFASLMDPEDPGCPIRMQAVPSINETRELPWEMKDPLREEYYSPVANIVHRYPDRALLLSTRQCGMYCRYCTRRRKVGEEDLAIGDEDKEKAIDYIAKTPQVRDVLVSGGDPLTLSDDALENILSRLRAIEHVEIIRIGTRIPAVMPMRITPSLLSMIRKYHPIWMNTHFNHPRELTAESLSACAAIADAGVPLGNQSVLLKGINDDADTMKELLLKLVKARIRPYYIYQCDLCVGIDHFRTTVETGIEIIKSLTGNISGLAIPKFVIDAPNGGGKIPVNRENIISFSDDEVALMNFEGAVFTYPQPNAGFGPQGVKG